MRAVPLSDVLGVIGLAKAHLECGASRPGAVGAEAARVIERLKELPPLQGTFPLSRHPVTKHLDAAYEVGGVETARLLEAFRRIARNLPWTYGYTKRKDSPGLERRMGWAEIIGPEAPFRSDRVCLGFTLIGPETLYPAHAHPAVELYYVVAGTAKWTADGVSHFNPPGTFILHPSNVVHSMETGREPLLALYTWTGADVTTTSYYTHE